MITILDVFDFPIFLKSETSESVGFRNRIENTFRSCAADRLEFIFLRKMNKVGLIIAHHGPMSRDYNYFQAINLLEFIRFRISRTRHTGQLVIHAEKILENSSLWFSI